MHTFGKMNEIKIGVFVTISMRAFRANGRLKFIQEWYEGDLNILRNTWASC